MLLKSLGEVVYLSSVELRFENDVSFLAHLTSAAGTSDVIWLLAMGPKYIQQTATEPMHIGHDQSQSQKLSIHWRAPSAIIVPLLVALLSAACHHTLYCLLDSTEVSDNTFTQQAVVTAGTTLALLFRASLMIGLITAYNQVFWWFVRRKTIDFATLDSLADLVSSTFALLNYRAVAFSPVLAVLAALVWLIPLATIVPPATLSVRRHTVTTTSSFYPYTVDYQAETLAKYSNGFVMNEINSHTWYNSAFSWYGQPSNQLLRTTKATALQGYVRQMQGYQANATYQLDFYGPSVRCEAIDPDVMKGWNVPLQCDPRGSSSEESTSCQLKFDQPRSLQSNRLTYMYIGWLPDDENVIPFSNRSLESPTLPDTRGSLGSHKGGPVSIFAASRLNMTGYEWQVLNCSFFNATFTADFAFDERKMALPVLREVQTIHPITASIKNPWHANTALGPKNAVLFNYMAIMECLCDMLYGMAYTPVAANSPLANDASRWRPLLSQTALSLTREINPMMSSALKKHVANDSDWTFPAQQPVYPPDTTEEQRFSMAYPTRYFKSLAFGRPLSAAIEELFHNMTLSLFSEASYLRRDSEPVDMITSRDRIIYVYEPLRLLLSYGMALGLALFASIGGLLSIAANRMSYSNRISTHVRTIAQPTTTALLQSNDESGADPLPESIARSTVKWRSARSSLLDGEERNN
jgi:hypothetical protein